jgi:hypothetical protein
MVTCISYHAGLRGVGVLFMNRNEFSFFADFFVMIFETREEYGFFQHPSEKGSVNSNGAKD